MSYTKTVWNDDKAPFIEASNLNKMEDGIKTACDGVDALNVGMDAVDENISQRNLKTYTGVGQFNMSIDDIIALNVFPTNSFITLQLTAAQATTLYNNGVIPINESGTLIIITGGATAKASALFMNNNYLFKNFSSNYSTYGFYDWDKVATNREGTVLWTNPDSTAEFGAQTITLSEDISNYEYYDIEYCYASSSSTNRSVRFKTGKISRNARTRLMTHAQYNFTRQINAPSGTSMEIADCNRYSSYGSAETEITNTVLVPIRVIGYKNL